MSRIHLFLIGAAAAISLALLWLTEIPLGIPSEWTWDRIRADDGWGVVFGIVQASIFAGLLIVVVWLGNRRVEHARKSEVAAWLIALIVASFAWLIAVQESPGEGHRLSKAPWVLYYPGSSGYFDYARYEVNNVDELLAGYEDLMKKGDVLHQGTHPPGLFLYYRGLIRAVDACPPLAEFAHWSMPESAKEAFAIIEENTRGQPKFPTHADQAVIWWAFLVTQAASVFVIVPLYFFTRMKFNRTVAWQSVAFWPFVPAVAIFLPKSDVLFSGVSITLVWLWCVAARRNSIWLGAAAGLVGFVGLLCSLAFLPVGLIAFLIPALAASIDQAGSIGNRVVPALKQQRLAIAGGLICLAAATALIGLWDVNLLNVWRMNYVNHAGFYAAYTRTTWLWTLINPLEFAVALGLPVAVLAAGSARVMFRRAKGNAWEFSVIVATVGVWAALLISGKNSGEAARLWVPLMPLIVACIPTLLSRCDPKIDRAWLSLLILQSIVAILTVSRVSGFHFG